MSKRYGWTEDYILDELPYARFLKKAEVIMEQRKKEYMEQKERDLYQAWLNYQNQPVYSKDTEKLSFYQYMKQLGAKDLIEKYRSIYNDKKRLEEGIKKAKETKDDVIDFISKKAKKEQG